MAMASGQKSRRLGSVPAPRAGAGVRPPPAIPAAITAGPDSTPSPRQPSAAAAAAEAEGHQHVSVEIPLVSGRQRRSVHHERRPLVASTGSLLGPRQQPTAVRTPLRWPGRQTRVLAAWTLAVVHHSLHIVSHARDHSAAVNGTSRPFYEGSVLSSIRRRGAVAPNGHPHR